MIRPPLKNASPNKAAIASASRPEVSPVTENAWRTLKQFTDARVGLGRAGVSLPTKHALAFQLAHAKAQDAVHTQFDITLLREQILQQDWQIEDTPQILHSRACDRQIYLQRPDYGRLLAETSALCLDKFRAQTDQVYDLVIAVVDGLSALAIQQNTIPFLRALLSELAVASPSAVGDTVLSPDSSSWRIGPICLVEQGRVAIGDDIGQRLKAKCVLVLVGERPGLSSPDSLGLYLTWNPKVGLSNAYRNCISNVRPAGLSYQAAARKAAYLLTQAKAKQLSGVQLKECAEPDNKLNTARSSGNFLIS